MNICDERMKRAAGCLGGGSPTGENSIFIVDYCILLHERLSIVDVEHGAQPLHDVNNNRGLAFNWEIYNHKELARKLNKNHDWKTNSDCEVLLYLYDEFGLDFLNDLDGIFSFCLYDPNKRDFLINDVIENPTKYVKAYWQGRK